MLKWLKKPYVIIGIGVGVGVVTCVVKVFQRQGANSEISTITSDKISRIVKIPKGLVGHVLGRGGQTIKSIREKTKTKINFSDIDDEFTNANIIGLSESVEEAADLINEIILNRHACITKEICLNETITDSVWKNISSIRQICDLSRAKITFDFKPSKGKDSQVKIVIKGRKEEVDAAVELVDELVAQVEVNTTNKQTHVAGRALPENLPLHTHALQNLPVEKLIPSNSDGYQEVYVSAIESPSKFWVQIAGSKSIQLDKLVTEMTEFYNEGKNKEKFRPNSIKVGDVVAAVFEVDNSWYRAQVLEVSGKGSDTKISLFYLDFGDSADVSPDLVCVIKPDFLSIPFQAIECSLYDVVPVGEEWTEEALDEFEKMAYVARWKILMAKPIQKPTRNGEKLDDSIQFVEIIDTNTDRNINISEELIVKGFAKFACYS
ncbi:Tudor and KH domain-containing protein like [Argiope bruennichi]|uniref:Tudor and KH domain-containing protein like n=1 Tax=Argiope bruennichi TaxID=94029 RepID=A0A8T0F885_ARGBR|nr:Tudor and KH domain-containing protein like [Argiope bruennichi]